MNILTELKKEWNKTAKYLGLKFAEDAKVFTNDELKISDRVIGAKVELINEDGTLAPAPDADYEMEDGFKFTVKDSLIESIEGEEKAEEKPVEEPAEEVKMEEEVPVEVIEEDDKVMEMLKEVIAKVDTLSQDVEALKNNNKVEEVAEQFSKDLGEVKQVIIQLSKLPAQESKTSKSNPVAIQREKNQNQMSALAKAFAKK